VADAFAMGPFQYALAVGVDGTGHQSQRDREQVTRSGEMNRDAFYSNERAVPNDAAQPEHDQWQDFLRRSSADDINP
jgi:hypothetical protein